MKNINKLFAGVVMFLLMNASLSVFAQDYKITNEVPYSGNYSDIIDYDIPAKLTPGQDYTVSITIVNTGRNTWVRGDNFYLKLYDESDNNYQSDVWGVNKVDIPYDIKPSDKANMIFKITAPKTSGVYSQKWAMVSNNEFFGEYTNNTVNVGGENITVSSEYLGNNSEFVNVSVPSSMNAGEKYKVVATMKNSGNTAWSSLNNEYMLAPVTQSSDITYPDWNSAPVYFSNSIEPGQSAEVEFYVTAPMTPGIYDLQWIMKKGDNYFGQKTNNVSVNVTGGNRVADDKTYNASFLEQTVPTSMAFNEMQDISVTVSNTGNKTWIKGNEQLVMIDPKMAAVTINLWNVGYVQLPENVEPGGLVTFKFKVKPTETGWQYFQCSMMKADGTLFGAPSQSVEVIVSKK
ncbi:MAG: hypothetical protein IPL53_22165 [Ignavibacteria bacterium]|nr:hypothetical protein [Ignavibacteria bacterium]